MRLHIHIGQLTIVGALISCGLIMSCGGEEVAEDQASCLAIGPEAPRDLNNASSAESTAVAQLNVQPGVLTFPEVSIGEVTEPQTVTLANTGDAHLRLTDLRIVEEDDVREFWPADERTREIVRERECVTIAPNNSLDLNFEWLPIDRRVDQGTFRFKSNDPRQRQKSVAVEFRTLTSAPVLEGPAAITFDEVALGAVETERITIRNTGDAPAAIANVTIAPDIDALTASPTDGAEAWPNTLEPDASFDVAIAFRADTPAEVDATLLVALEGDDAQVLEIPISASVQTPCIELTREDGSVLSDGDVLEFGMMPVGETRSTSFTIVNCSMSAPLTVEQIFTSRMGAEHFTVSLPADLEMIPPQKTRTVQIDYTPMEAGYHQTSVAIESASPEDMTVEVRGEAMASGCPEAVATARVEGEAGPPMTMVSTIPLKTIALSALESRDSNGSVERYEWSIVRRPSNSTARLTPNSTVPEPKLFLDLAGEYEIELTVYDDRDTRSCNTARVVIQTNGNNDIHVQLVWNTPADGDPNDDSAYDLDLHYLNEGKGTWNTEPYDIFWRSPDADWGVSGDPSDDPSLDIDDTSGSGPENVNHNNPAPGQTYTIGVYAYDDGGFPATYATVRIYIDGTLIQEFKDTYINQARSFWEVAAITWPSKQIFARDRIYAQGFPQ